MTNEQTLVERLLAAASSCDRNAASAERMSGGLMIMGEALREREHAKRYRETAAQIADLKRALDTARHDAMEEAAKDCDRVEKRFNDKARISNGDVYALGVAGGAGICAENIRSLQTKDQSHEEWREIEQHVQPRLADGYTDIRVSKPGFWFVKGPGPASSLSASPLSQGGQE